jgi:hypothetical protein
VWEPRAGQWNLTVCLKATFTLEEEPRPSSEQDGSHDDVYWEQTPHASLYSPSDFAPIKPRVDILLVGSAFAPGGGTVDELTARLSVGDLSKALRVVGDRQWIPAASGPQPSAPRPFARMALRYEHASHRGDNVVGAPSADTSRPPPNIDVEGASPGATPGFAPIAPAWRHRSRPLSPAAMAWVQRLNGATVHDAGVSGMVAPPSDAGPAPVELDFAFFNTAPRDQLMGALTPGTPVVLENLHPQVARLSFRLPAVEPVIFHVDPRSGAPREVIARCDTLWIDTDRRVFVISWRAVTPVVLTSDRQVGRVVCAARAPGQPVSFTDLEAPRTPPPPKQPASKAHATVSLPAFGAPPPMNTPFPIAAARTASSAPAPAIVGAPWAPTPPPLVPAPDPNLRSTADEATLAQLAHTYTHVEDDPEQPDAPPPVPPAAAPPMAPAAPPEAPPSVVAPAAAPVAASPWRQEDPAPAAAPTAPTPPPTPPPAPSVGPPPVGAQVKKGVYGRFGR